MADWFEQIRRRYQGAMSVPSRDMAVLAAMALAPKPVTVQATPPMVSDADMALPTMAPAGPLAPPAAVMPTVTVAASRPPLAAPVAPEQPMDTYADMAGYGGSPRLPDAPDYRHLNPTPSLAEVYRREYAANPNGFTPGRFFGLLG